MPYLREWTYEELAKYFEGKEGSRTFANNTTIEKQHIEANSITPKSIYFVVRLHGSAIIFIYEDKVSIIHKQRKTQTTKERMNRVLIPLGYNLYQKQFVWYVHNRSTGEKVPYFEGMILR